MYSELKTKTSPEKIKYWIEECDGPRYIVRTVQSMLRSINMPADEKSWAFSRITFYILFANMLIMQAAHVSFMVLHITDVAKMADTCATVSTTFQGIVKLLSLYLNSKNIQWMIRTVYGGFWPTTILPKNAKCYISMNRLAGCCYYLMLSFYALIFFCCSLLLIPPMFLGARSLPLASVYPFEWDKSPLYETMYVWQWILNLYGVCFVVGTHDFLFVAMMVQLIVQFTLLQKMLLRIGTDDEQNTYLTLSKNTVLSNRIKNEDKLLTQCVIHHIKILKFADVVEKTFSPVVFSQFVESVSGLCLGVFLVNLVDGVNFIKLVFFIIGHLAQLLLYCMFGNEVMYQSGCVADAAFRAQWHLQYKPSVRNGLLMIIQRAQRIKKITALGMADLNILSFIEVLRSSISFSTLLKTFIDKQKNPSS